MNINQDNSSPLIKFTPGKENFSSGSSGTDIGTRPTSDPKSAKSFKKVLNREPQGKKNKDEDINIKSVAEEEEEIASANEEEQTMQKKGSVSLFDLSGSNAANAAKSANKAEGRFLAPSEKTFADTSAIDPDAGADENEEIESSKSIKPKKPESPSSVFAQMSTKDAKSLHGPGNVVAKHPSKIESKKQNFTSRFGTEQTDLSYVNPMALAAQPTGEVYLRTQKTTLPVSNVQDIINQLVEKVTEMKDQGRTDTIITLKQPPTLAGANLVVTSFDSAKGEFNISFENLTQAAKNMLDQGANQQSLKLALEEKGYAVHIITTTTLIENRPIDMPQSQQGGDDSREGREGRKEGRQQQRNQDRTG